MISTVVYLACVAGVAYYADSKGRSPIVWGLVAVLTTPLLAVIILAFLKNLKNEQNLQQVLNQQEQINDRISVNEINNNRRFENIENDVKQLEDKQGQGVEAAASLALGSAAEAVQQEEKSEPAVDEVAEPAPQAEAEAPVASAVASAVSKCPYCDGEVPAGSKFCGNCGAKL